jgi:hypothetical protein
MSDWQPTMELRFVKRMVNQMMKYYGREETVEKRILQQRWQLVIENTRTQYEWRDVPTEEGK